MKKHYMIVLAMAALAAAPAFAQVRAASEPVKLLESPVGLMAPVWSPDGSKIAVTTDNYAGILVAEADGSNLRALTSDAGAGYKMSWSADSRAIIGSAKIADGARTYRELRSYDLGSRAAATVAARSRGAAEPASLNASGIYGAMVSDPAGATKTVAALSQFAGKTVINPALSPDGAVIAFQIPGKGMWTINADGSDLRSIGNGSHPAWMPDSRTLVYTIVSDNGNEFTGSSLMSMDLATGRRAVVYNVPGFIPVTPSVAPDGSKVAFENAADASIYVMNLQF